MEKKWFEIFGKSIVKTFKFKIYLKSAEVGTTSFMAKDQQTAQNLVQKQYPPSKGFVCELVND